jgi:hypothetical protein
MGLALLIWPGKKHEGETEMSREYTIDMNGEQYTIPQSDLWSRPGVEKDIISHDGIRRLMLKAGITVEKVEPIVMPISDSAVRIAFLVSGTNAEGRRTFAVGESDPSNLAPNTVASRYPTIMAFKRGVDRLVLDLLGLFDLYSDTEFSEPTTTQQTPSPSNGDANGVKPNGGEPSSSKPQDASGSPNHQQHSGELEPTSKQISYLWQLGLKNGLRESEIDQMLKLLKTREGASKLIAKMRQAA